MLTGIHYFPRAPCLRWLAPRRSHLRWMYSVKELFKNDSGIISFFFYSGDVLFFSFLNAWMVIVPVNTEDLTEKKSLYSIQRDLKMWKSFLFYSFNAFRMPLCIYIYTLNRPFYFQPQSRNEFSEQNPCLIFQSDCIGKHETSRDSGQRTGLCSAFTRCNLS